MKKIDIIMFGMSSYNEWNLRGINNRNYNIFKSLVADERVGKILYIDYVPITRKRAIRNFIENFLTPIKGGQVLIHNRRERLTALQDRVFVYSTTLTTKHKSKIYENIKTHAVNLGFSNTVTWSFFPFLTDYMEGYFGQCMNIFDAVDNWAQHPSYKNYSDELNRNYSYIDQHADLIFTVAREQQSLFPTNQKAFWVPNGIDTKLFDKDHKLITRDIGNIKKPIIGYVGTIQERFDVSLLAECAKLRPEYSFVLIGPTSRNWKSEIFGFVSKDEIDLSPLQKLPNVYFLGRKPYEQLPAYLKQFEVGIIPHKDDEFVRSNNPMKMYDYLAAGLPVVASPTSGADIFDGLVYIARTPEEFVHLLDRFVSLTTGERQVIKQKSIEASSGHSWGSRVEFMLSEVFNKIDS